MVAPEVIFVWPPKTMYATVQPQRMPIYEYACRSCGHELEISQRISEEPAQICPKCNAPALERLVSQSSFALKGQGWYADGYGGTREQSGAKKGTEEPKSTEPKKSTDKAESKAAEKPKAETPKKSEPKKSA